MNAKDATKMLVHLCGFESVPPSRLKDVETMMEIILSTRQEGEKRGTVKEAPNEIKQEDNTINLQDVDHFEMPEEINVAMEGEDAVRKIKIFPDGVSETPAAEAETTAPAN